MPHDLAPSEAAPIPAEAAPAPPRRGAALWMLVGLAVAMLAGSGVARAWQARRVDQVLRDGRKALFPLKAIPTTLGPWVGTDQVVDERVIRITGSTDSIFRSYQHQGTGQHVNLLVLFGPATLMSAHVPEVCYPASGYQRVSGPAPRAIAAGGRSWPFRELVYTKGEGGQADTWESHYSWRYDRKWSPDPGSYKQLQRIPSMYKVQADRRVRGPGELAVLGEDNPSEDLIARVMVELEARIAAAEAERRP